MTTNSNTKGTAMKLIAPNNVSVVRMRDYEENVSVS